MIEIKVDKESEVVWLDSVINAGIINNTQGYTFKFLGIPLNQNVNYTKSDDYEDDIKEKRDEYNKRFAGLTGMQVNEILRKEYNKN